MNNRLHKLTDSLESELNYLSRKTQRARQLKPQHRSPLLNHDPQPTLRLPSRHSSPMATPPRPSLHHSALQSSSSSQDSNEILIIDSPETNQILIIDSEQPQDEEYQEKTQFQQEHDMQQAQLPKTPSVEEKHESPPSSKKDSPIYILEQDDQNLLWIQRDEQEEMPFFGTITPKSGSIKIEDDQPEEEHIERGQNPKINENIKVVEEDEESQIDYILPYMAELSSIEEQQVEQSFQMLGTSRIPVSPQTTQPFLPTNKTDHLILEQQQYWITQENHLGQQEQASKMEKEEVLSVSESYFYESNSMRESVKRLVSPSKVRQVLQKEDRRSFQGSLLDTSRLKVDISPRKVRSIQKMQQLIEKQSQKVKQRLLRQQGAINMLRTAISHRLKLPLLQSPCDVLDLDTQILVNRSIISCLLSINAAII